jgi:hypothetical protein
MEVEAWPTPSKGDFNLKVKTENTEDTVKITVYDMNNRLVHSTAFDHDQTHRFGRLLDAGVYLVRIEQGDQMVQVRLVRM